MTVAILKLIIFIGHCNSLKSKRMVLHSLESRLRNKFNIAICEVDDRDKWQKSTLAIVSVNTDKQYMDRTISKIVNFPFV